MVGERTRRRAIVAGEFHFSSEFQLGTLGALPPACGAVNVDPLVSRDGRMTCLFEGHLVNGGDLRTRLTLPGSADDAATVLACFEERGPDGLRMLDGAFSLAIHDTERRELFLARDRVGQLPLFYHLDGDVLRFSSDLRALAQAAGRRLPLDMRAVEAYLQLTYIPAPFTIHDGISQLPPAAYLRVGSAEPSEPMAYWDLDHSDANQLDDLDACRSMLREALTEAVEEALGYPGRMGAFLSGGIDSTIVTGIASSLLDRPLDTFTISLDDHRYDETARARLSAELHGTRHHVITVDPDDVLSGLDAMLDNLDQPYGDSSYVAALAASSAASDHVDAVLTGDAGDELFAGYSKYLIDHYGRLLSVVPAWLRRPAVGAANALLPAQSHLRRKVNKVADSVDLEPFERRERLMSLGFPGPRLQSLMIAPPSGATSALIRRHYDWFEGIQDEMRRALYLDFKVVLEGDMMPKAFYAGRATGLVTSIPMLNRKVIEAASRIPTRFKIRRRNTKAILKETFRDLIPTELLTARKSGFSLPIGSWLRGPLRSRVANVLSEERIRAIGLVHPAEVRRLLDEHFAGHADHSSQLWILFVLMDWLERRG